MLNLHAEMAAVRVEQLSPTVPSGSAQPPGLIATESTSKCSLQAALQRGTSHDGPIRGDLLFFVECLGASAPSYERRPPPGRCDVIAK
ncbi:hypothetical protein RISK_004361 [Rhodopirellula islandica]|uniref:Uncharacterized protein n=1 Tax=Rhodopirellula islandica TaxID=595434 RepID=A0A0J1BAT2_RHOIS|nr:hypothetical protein RISK_004361 [Rhodopirellula islandica]